MVFFIYTCMITQFKLFESTQNNINLPQDLFDKLVDTLSLVVYKGNKRDEQKNKNFKSCRLLNLDGYYNTNKVNNKQKTTDCLFEIKMTNKDKIIAQYKNVVEIDDVIENSIYIEINGEKLFHLDSESYNINSFIEKIGTIYQKYIKDKKWKIK